MSSNGTLLRVRGLKLHFPVRSATRGAREWVRAVDGVDLDLERGQTLGLVGESGCGKTTVGRAVLQLIRPTAGSVTFDDIELTELWQRRFGTYRWHPKLRELRQRMQMIFQDPYASLNPRMTVEGLIGEPLLTFQRAQGRDLRVRVQELMERVGLDPRYVRRYPHEFSGGQRQRIGIARALALDPELIVCDEPISALDVSIQAQILNLLHDLQADLGLTYLFIAHDLAAVQHISTQIVVMYLGHVVEVGPARSVCQNPKHPYTRALISAVPVPDPDAERKRHRLPLVGDIPSPIHPPPGCTFHTRCPDVVERCRQDAPVLREIGKGRRAACHLVAESSQ